MFSFNIADTDEDEKDFKISESLPILPLRNTVLFPGVIVPISLGRNKSLKLIKDALAKDGYFGAVAQKETKIEDPKEKDLYKVGTVGKIIKMLEMPDGSTSAIIQGKSRFIVDEFISDDPYFTAKVTKLKIEGSDNLESEDFKGLVESLKDLAIKIIENSANIPNDISFAVRNIDNPSFLINFLASNNDIAVSGKQGMLEMSSIQEMGMKLLEHLMKEAQLLDIKNDIQSKVKVEVDQQQREYFLQQQIKTIQNELGGNPIEADIMELRKRAEKVKWNKEVAEMFDKELNKLERLNPMTGEYSLQYNYLTSLLDLPWGIYTRDKFNINTAKRLLDKDHFGLDEVKERILEHLAVLKLKGDLKSPIICLYGPPGVGKTSLGKSVADALGRKYVRMSLGGIHDEAEIRGHRKTYIGAMPGRIIQNINKAGSSNPVFILDEIDKLTSSAHGDPSAALLEVLDPEQNEKFHDNYLEVDYDLSKVLFIATANSLSNISQPLLDRMELIDVSGYVLDEKIEIARHFIWPRQMKNHGIEKAKLSINKKTAAFIIESYTRESGVRELDKVFAKLARKYALKIASDEDIKKTISVSVAKELLGVPKFVKERWEEVHVPGVVTGLAWTAVGGEILNIECSLSKGKGKLTLTGNLGNVMKESAILALEYIKSNCDELGINHEVFEENNVHIHVPEGAIPKDGPSAGITMATALTSVFTNKVVNKRLAMTGEITLIGKVLPVGGIKEKILAAKRANITDIILSKENERNITEIKDMYLEGLKFHFVRNIKEVLDIALK